MVDEVDAGESLLAEAAGCYVPLRRRHFLRSPPMSSKRIAIRAGCSCPGTVATRRDESFLISRLMKPSEFSGINRDPSGAQMASASIVVTDSFPLIRLPRIHCKPLLSSLVFFASDTIAITLTGTLVLWGSGRDLDIRRYFALWPALGVFFAVFAYSSLYPGIIHNAVDELRRLAFALTIGFLLVAGMIYLTRSVESYPCAVLLLWWLAAVVVTPILRSVVRKVVSRRPWWGIPVAVFYTGDESAEIIRELENHPEIGLRPVVILSSLDAPRHRLPVLDLRFAAAVRACGVERAMIALPDAGSGKLLEDLENVREYLSAFNDPAQCDGSLQPHSRRPASRWLFSA
jgi:hypothetical protein